MGRIGHASALLVVTTALAGALAAGCDGVTPVSPPATSLPVALWSPAEGVLPFPDASFLAAGSIPAASDPVRAALLRFVADYAGAPVDAPVAVELSAPVDPATLDGVAFVRDDGSRVDVDATVTLGGRGVRLTPRAPLVAGQSYTLVVAGLKTASGAAFGRSPSFAFAAGDDSVPLDALPAPSGSPAPTAALLTTLRPAVGAALDAAEAAGFAREDVAVASRFTAVDAPRVDFDVARHTQPWPSDFAVDDSGRTTLPPGAVDAMLSADQLAAAREAVAEVPGFSTSARVRVPLLGRADAAAGFSLHRLDDASAVDGVDAATSADASTVFLQKKPALDAATSYVVVVDESARAGGAPIRPSLDAALLLAEGPLARSGASTTALLDDVTARKVEAERAKLAPFLDQLAARGTSRAELALAVPFTTVDAFAFVDEKAKLLEDRHVEPALHDVVVQSPWDRGLYAVMPHVDTVVTGTYTSLDSIDPVTLRAAEPRQSEVPFLLVMPPESARGPGPVPVVVFGHGLITAKELAYLIADQLAQAGFATFSIDLPMHGARTVCLVDAHCDPFETCGADHQCKNLDGTPGSLASADSLWDGGPKIPVATGEAFVLVDDLVASRDHFLQGVVDLRQGLRLLAAGGLDDDAGAALQRDGFGWLGISLGGIFGAAMSGSTEAIDRFVLNVPGADLVVTLEDSTVLKPLLLQAMASHGVSAGSPEYADYEDLAHLVLDPVDPLNLAPRATVRVPAAWARKRVILQMADTDLVVPNSATRVLSAVTGVDISEYHPLVSNHAFLLDPTSIEGGRARDQAVSFLSAP